jgi:hypothetical protein
MKAFGFAIALVLAASPVRPQLAAPGALDDFSGCNRDGCTWVPMFTKRQSYEKNDLTYSVHATENPDDGLFRLKRGVKTIYTTNLKDLSASVSVVWTAAGDWFAITWSNGGAVGGFQTRVFHVEGDKVTERYAARAALREFRSRHSCRARGENEQAYRWDEQTGALILVMSVYPTSDCGRDMGHTEAYFVDPADGKVVRHLTGSQFEVYVKNQRSSS